MPSELIASLVTLASVALSVFGIIICVNASGSVKPILPFIIITALLFLTSASATSASIIPLIFISVALFAYLCESLASHLLLLAAIPAYAITFLVLRDYILSLFSLVVILSGYLLHRAYKTGEQRVGSICRLSVALGASSLAILSLLLYANYGSSMLDALKAFFDTLREMIVENMAQTLFLATEQISSGVLLEADLFELASVTVTEVFNILPAIIIILLFIISYVIHSLYVALIIPITEDKERIQNAVTFKMSVTSAVIFIVSALALLILSQTEKAMYAAAAQNIYVIFFPGLSVIAIGFFLGRSRSQGASCLGFLFNIALIGSFIYAPHVAFPVASFIGAGVVIFSAFRAKKKDKENP